MPRRSRRDFLALGAAGLGVSALAGMGWRTRGSRALPGSVASELAASEAAAATPTPAPPPPMPAATPPPTPTPPPERGRISLALMEGTEYETPATIWHSGAPGPVVMVLGGVHGNEPGSWVAAESMMDWEVERGSLIISPRVNRLSAARMQRTLEGFGDLNRLYPGDPNGMLPMSRMAHEIVEIARSFPIAVLLDLHESWGFYNERGDHRGTAFIGQTVTARGTREGSELMGTVVAEVNAQITEREHLLFRDRFGSGWGSGGGSGTPPRWMGGGSSSLGMGQYVPDCTAVLVEMGQQNQAESRRAELHQIVTRTTLQHLSMI
jgi:hypothetical protein